MACGSCGNRGKIRVSRMPRQALGEYAGKKVIKMQVTKTKSLKPANNIDKRN